MVAISLPSLSIFTTYTMPTQTFNDRRLVGVHAERITDVSSRDFPGHYPDEDHSWNLAKFKKVRRKFQLAYEVFSSNKRASQG